MSEANKCPKCDGTMQEGFIFDDGYVNLTASRWVADAPELAFGRWVKVAGKEQYQIRSFRCVKCGYLESYAKEPK
jgi:predicted nucleic-acid-binding Zn-ribbon protein